MLSLFIVFLLLLLVLFLLLMLYCCHRRRCYSHPMQHVLSLFECGYATRVHDIFMSIMVGQTWWVISLPNLGGLTRTKSTSCPSILNLDSYSHCIRIHYWRFSDAGFLVYLRRAKFMRSDSNMIGKALAMSEV